MQVTDRLSRALHKRFSSEVAEDLVPWLNRVSRPLAFVPWPSKRVVDALGVDVVDELLDVIVAVHNGAPPPQRS